MRDCMHALRFEGLFFCGGLVGPFIWVLIGDERGLVFSMQGLRVSKVSLCVMHACICEGLRIRDIDG